MFNYKSMATFIVGGLILYYITRELDKNDKAENKELD